MLRSPIQSGTPIIFALIIYLCRCFHLTKNRKCIRPIRVVTCTPQIFTKISLEEHRCVYKRDKDEAVCLGWTRKGKSPLVSFGTPSPKLHTPPLYTYLSSRQSLLYTLPATIAELFSLQPAHTPPCSALLSLLRCVRWCVCSCLKCQRLQPRKPQKLAVT